MGAPRLGLFSVVAVGLNTIIGSGIFRLPAELAHDLGPASLVAFALGVLLLCAVALPYAEAGGMFERDGGSYVYARAAFGRHVGYAIGWSAWVAIVTTLAAVAVALPGQIAELWPAAAQPGPARAIALAVVLGLGLVSCLGLRPAAWTSNALAVAKVLGLALFVAVGLFFVRPGNLTPLAPHGWSAVGPTLLVVLFSLSGFESPAVPAGEAARPRRDVPRAVLGSLLGAAGLYLLIQLVAVGVLPDLGKSERPLADAARVFLGDPGALAIAALGALSMLGLGAAMALCAPAQLAPLAEDGFLPPAMAGRAAAAVVSTAAAAGCAMWLDFHTLVTCTSVVAIVYYLATCIAVPVLRRTRPDAPRAVRLPFGPVIPAIGSLVLIYLLTQATAEELSLSGYALAGGVALAALYALVKR